MPQPFEHGENQYRTKKHCVLEHIFLRLTANGTQHLTEDLPFYHQDVIEAYDELALRRPTSSSNFVLDITRKNNGIDARVPELVQELGYDLRKKTGLDIHAEDRRKRKYAGEFVYVGKGYSADSWLTWPDPSAAQELHIPNRVPQRIRPHLHNDEAALFSVLDYCDLLSYALYKKPGVVLRVQNPMKWQPNELDGLYYAYIAGQDIFYPIEAKALSTGDDINLDQMWGGYQTMRQKRPAAQCVSLALRMVPQGVQVCVLSPGQISLSPIRDPEDGLRADRFIYVTLDPSIPAWEEA
jgi:hypothetical protein